MSGHSKWANIKHKKEANDRLRGSSFAKLSRLITLTILESGGQTDPELNVRLRLMVDKAKAFNMPKDTIQRAIDKGIGPDKSKLTEVVFEAFAPPNGTVHLVIVASTDNHNRSTSEVRNILESYAAKLGHQGSVLYFFQKCGKITINKNDTKEENVMIFSEECKAIDIDSDEQYYYVYIPFDEFGKLKSHQHVLSYKSAEIIYKPRTYISISQPVEQDKLKALIEALENHEDIVHVFGDHSFI